ANQSAMQIAGVPSIDVNTRVNLFSDPNISSRKEELLNKGLIKFQAPINFDKIKELGFYNPTRTGTAFIDYTVSTTDSGYLMQIQDITEHKNAENLLQTTLQRLYAILSRMYGAILLVSDKDRVEFANQAFCDFFNLDKSPEDLVGLNSDEMIEKIKNVYMHPNEAVIRISEIVDREQPVKGEEVALKDGRTCIRDFIPLYIDEKSNGRLWHHMDITDRKKTEEALKESEEEFKSLYSSIIEGVAIHEILYDSSNNAIDYTINDINPAYEDITGLKRSEVIGKKASELYGTGKPPYMDIYSRVAESGEPEHFKTYFEPMDKHFRIAVTSPDKGKFATFFEDITVRKQAEKALKKAHDNLELKVEERTNELKLASLYNRSLIEASLDPLVTIGPDGKITDVNTATELVTGYSRNELIGTDFSDYFTEPQKAKFGYQRVFREGEVRNYPLEIKNKNGNVTSVNYNASVYKDVNGEVIGIFAAARDITERKKAEKGLEAERQRFVDVMEILPAYVILLTQDYHVAFANRFFRERFGEDCGKRCFEYLFGLTEPCEDCETYKVLKTGAPHHWEWTGPDGRDYDIYDFPFKDTDGSLMIMEFGIDITERKKAEEQLKETITEMERSNKELQSFAYITSHDLQEPLRTMGSYAGLLKYRYGGQLDSDADEFIDYMVSGASRLQEMIKGLLDYSRVGTRGEEFKDFNAEEALDTALTNLKSPIEECHVEVLYDSLPVIHADESQISRVFQNLIGNALKFRKKDVQPKIHISSIKEGDEYIFSVQDNGIGMEEQYSGRIFEVFKRLHPIGEYEGAGIGLAIVKRIIERHHGRVWVESEYDEGSTFYFTIPVEPVETGGMGLS
ncbi:MAG: PAS domain-containing sensor histidine kinase, partial [Methanobacteriaceae archaeon]